MGYTVTIKVGTWPHGEARAAVVYEGREFVTNGKYRPVRVVAVLRDNSSINNLHADALEYVEFVVERAVADAMGQLTWSTWLHVRERGEYKVGSDERLEAQAGVDGAVFAHAMAVAVFGPDVVVDHGPYERAASPPSPIRRLRAIAD